MKIGILGGGQLGKMLLTPANQMDKEIHFMDSMLQGPISKVSKNYTVGNISDFDDVIKFGEDKDVISIEIEKVNIEALKELQKKGVLVYPQPDVVETIQDKGLQKEFYSLNKIPTSKYKCYTQLKELENDVHSGLMKYPFVQKLRKDGYDGRGVQIIRSESDLNNAFSAPFLVEEMVEIEKELAVVTCTNHEGKIVAYDPVEMVFHDEANILLYQLGPAAIDDGSIKVAKELAFKTAKSFGIIGLLAIELFLTKSGEILVNEVAPRPHNSGHHTIEASDCSQYENHIRVLSHLPLGSTKTVNYSLLMNVLGEEGHTGLVDYCGLDYVLDIPGVHVHIYGKTHTKPFRKMGHITIVDESYSSLIEKYNEINRTLRVISK